MKSSPDESSPSPSRADPAAPKRRFGERLLRMGRWVDSRITDPLTGLLAIPIVRTATIAVAVFVIDGLTPLGVAAGALYMAAVLSAVPMRHERAIYITAGVCSFLVFVGWIVSPGQGQTEWWKVLTNRFVDLGVIWAAAGMAGLWRRSQQRRFKQMLDTRLLHQATALSVSQLSFRDALQNSLKTLCDIVGWPVGHVYLRDANGRSLKASDIWHIQGDAGFELLRMATRGVRFTGDEGAAGRACRTGEPIAVANVSESPGYAWLKEPDRLGIVGAFLLPVTVAGKVVAVMEFFAEQAIEVDDEFMPLARNVGKQLGRLFERRKAESALRQSEERLRLALQGGRMGTWQWHLDTERVIWSPEVEAMYGREPGSLDGTLEAAYDAVHPQDRERVRHQIEEGLKDAGKFRVEYRVVRPDGSVQWIESRGAAHAEGDGQSQRVVGVCMNVTERREYEEQNARLAAIVQSSDDAILSKSVEGTILSWNPGAERVYGYTADEIVGRSVADLCPEDRKQDFAAIMSRISVGERVDHYETVRQRKDGQLIDISLSVSPIRDADGVVIGASAVARDITERKRAEREMAEAREKAETANRLQSRFLANMSHELRTPMNSILGMLQLTLSEDLTAETRGWLETARSSADALLALLNDVLDFSKMEAGSLTIHPDPFPLRAAVDATVRAFATKAFEKGLELVYDVADDLPAAVVGDKLRIRQVMTNLITNAIKFTAEGEVVVSVTCEERRPESAVVRFTVADSGSGISVEDRRRIFEPFIQSDATADGHHGGAGLGLAISRELVQRMGGELTVDSEVGEGSSFSFALTLDVADAEREELPDPPEIAGLPVLVVDQNEASREVLAKMLRGWSITAEEAVDYDHAVGKLYRAEMEGRRYQLAIVASGISDIDEVTFASRLEDTLETPPPLIFMGHPGDGAEQDAEVPGVYLEKPVCPSSLLACISQALGLEQTVVRTERPAPLVGPTDSPLRILVAEDTRANQEVVRSALERRGHRVTLADNGREAILMARNETFDVALMDVCMPEMGGFEATQAIRQAEADSGRRVPIIALTAHALQGDREKCLSAGMHDYLAKPIDVCRLIEVVESVAGERARRIQDAGRASEGTGKPGVDSSDADGRCEEGSMACRDHDEAIIDYPGTLQRLGGSETLLEDMARLFDEDSPALMATMRDAIDGKDAGELRRAAHSLKGLAANFGAKEAVKRAQELEDIGKAARLDAAPASLAELEHEVGRLTVALQRFRRSRDPSSQSSSDL